MLFTWPTIKLALLFPLFLHPQPLSWSISPNRILSLTFNSFWLTGCQPSEASQTLRTFVWLNSHFLVLPCHCHETDMPRLDHRSPQRITETKEQSWVVVVTVNPLSPSDYEQLTTRHSSSRAKAGASPPPAALHQPHGCFSGSTAVAADAEDGNGTVTPNCHRIRVHSILFGAIWLLEVKSDKEANRMTGIAEEKKEAREIAPMLGGSEDLGKNAASNSWENKYSMYIPNGTLVCK